MTVKETICLIENIYKNSDLIYESLFARFVNLTGFSFQSITLKKGSSVFRARYHCNDVSSDMIKDFSYPPKPCVKDFSRLNRPYQNLFYASESYQACIAEMTPYWFDEFETGDVIKVVIGKWVIRKDIKLIVIPDFQNSSELTKKVLNQFQKGEVEFWEYITSKFKESRKKDKNIYEFTSSLANALWLNTKLQKINCDGFINTSVQSDSNMNIALSPEVIDLDNIQPAEFNEITFKRTGYNETGLPTYCSIGNIRHGIVKVDDSIIEWID